MLLFYMINDDHLSRRGSVVWLLLQSKTRSEVYASLFMDEMANSTFNVLQVHQFASLAQSEKFGADDVIYYSNNMSQFL